MDFISDKELIEDYFDGNHRAFEDIVNRYSQLVYRFSFRLLNNQEEARDITQETFIKVWKNLKKFDTDKNLKVWIFIIAKRTVIDYARKRKMISFSDMNDQNTDSDSAVEDFGQSIADNELLPDEIFEKEENALLVRQTLEKLSLENRTIVLLRNGEEMTFEEIAEVLDKPMNTVKSQYRRTLIELKKIIAPKFTPST